MPISSFPVLPKSARPIFSMDSQPNLCNANALIHASEKIVKRLILPAANFWTHIAENERRLIRDSLFSNTAFAARKLQQINRMASLWEALIEYEDTLFSDPSGMLKSRKDEFFVLLRCRANCSSLLNLLATIDPHAAEEMKKVSTYNSFMNGSLETALTIANALVELR
jgi:hypothetical protein